MDLKHLRSFAVVATAKGVGRAARALRIAQPALSRQVQALERFLETRLLDREQQGVRVTPAGSVLLEGIGEFERSMLLALHRARLAQDGRLGRLRLGMGRVALESVPVGRSLAALHRFHPEITLEIVELASPQHSAALLTGDIDLAIGTDGSFPHSRLERRVLYTLAVDSALIASSHRFAGATVIDVSELAAEPLLLAGRASGWLHPGLRETLRAMGAGEPREYDSLDTVYNLVAGRRGWLPVAGAHHAPAPGTTIVPLAGLSAEIPLTLRWRRDRSSPVLDRACALILRVASREKDAGTSPPAPVATRPHADEPPIAEFPAALELRPLRALVTVLEEGSVIDASRRLGVTQSGLSRQLSALERAVGLPLLRRVRNGIGTTPAGEVLRTEAGAALASLESTFASIRGLGQGVAHRVVVGAIPAELAGGTMGRMLNRAAKRLPLMAIELREVASYAQADAILRGELDAGVAVGAPGVADDPRIAVRRLTHDAFDAALVSVESPLAKRESLGASDLADLPLLFFPRASNPLFHDAVMRALLAAGLTPRLGSYCTGPRATWRLAADRLGWALGTASMRESPPPGLIAVPLRGFSVPAGAQLLWRRGETNPHVLSMLTAFE